MDFQEFKFHLQRAEIYGRYTAPQTVKGVVVLVHGFGEHSGRYDESVISVLSNSGFAVVTYDNIGHGRSGGKRGHCPNYTTLIDILETVIVKTREFYAGVSLFLYGHSMGGNLVLNYALNKEVTLSGIVATSPYLRLAFQPPKWKLLIGKFFLKILPSLTLASGLDAKGISRIPEEVEKYRTDPLVHDRVSPMFSFPIMDAGEWAIQNATKLSIDTLLVHGTADRIIDCKGTEAFHGNSDKTTLKLFEGGYHELHNDSCREEMLSTITNWLNQQLV